MISEIHTHEDPILTREEAIEILNTPDDQLDMLIERAGILRKKYKGNRVSIHILTNVRSGNCTQDCAYCAQSCRSDADIDTYKWLDDDKLYNDNDFVNEYHLSRHCIGLSGMGFTDADIEQLAGRIRKMKETGTHLCCSIGFLSEKQAKTFHGTIDKKTRMVYNNTCNNEAEQSPFSPYCYRHDNVNRFHVRVIFVVRRRFFVRFFVYYGGA